VPKSKSSTLVHELNDLNSPYDLQQWKKKKEFSLPPIPPISRRPNIEQRDNTENYKQQSISFFTQEQSKDPKLKLYK
jgi:hypothetical protein